MISQYRKSSTSRIGNQESINHLISTQQSERTNRQVCKMVFSFYSALKSLFWPLGLRKYHQMRLSLIKSNLAKMQNGLYLNQERNYQFYYQQVASPTKMMRKMNCQSILPHTHLQIAKDASHSLSTQESPRQMNSNYPAHKQKSQLCKKFVENGYCPYEKKCKFAHGLHELKKNQQTNSKYKTKTCGSFLQEGYCPYGNRCNFIHPTLATTADKLDSDDFDFRQIKISAKRQSRLLVLLAK